MGDHDATHLPRPTSLSFDVLNEGDRIWCGKTRMAGYNLVKVAWWSTQSFGHNTSTWQTGSAIAWQTHSHVAITNARRQRMRRAAKTNQNHSHPAHSVYKALSRGPHTQTCQVVLYAKTQRARVSLFWPNFKTKQDRFVLFLHQLI